MPTIVDHRGVPFDRAALAAPQTAHIAQLHAEFANHPTRGLTPAKLAQVLRAAEQGDIVSQHEMFLDMEEKDGHLFSLMQTRRLTLLGLDWDVVPPNGASKAEVADAAYAKEVLLSMEDLEDVLFDMTDGIGHGFSALELAWARMGRDQVPVRATHRPQAWFRVPSSPGTDRNELRLRDNSADGAQLWPFGWIMHRHKARSGYATRDGLFRVMAWPWLFKNYAWRDLAEFLEIYGLPTRLGTYGPSATKDDKATLMRAVVGIGHNAAGIIPEGMRIDLLAAAQGDGKAFDAMISGMERVMSRVALGGTLTGGEGAHGTQALGNVHNELRGDLKKADARQLGSTLTRQVVYPILAINRGLADMRRCPRVVFDTQEPEDVKLLSDALPKLVSMGMRIKRGWAHDKLKIPEGAEGDKDLLAVPRPELLLPPADRVPAPAPQPGQAQLRAALAAGAPGAPGAPANEPGAAPDALDMLAADMLAEWQDGMGELAPLVQQALDDATSFDDFGRALEAGLLGLTQPHLIDLLARGAFAARVWGQLNLVKKSNAEK